MLRPERKPSFIERLEAIPDIIRYVVDHGDKSFEEKPYTDVDALVFATLIYGPFQLLPQSSEPYTIRSATEYLLTVDNLSEHILIKGDDNLLAACGESRRFADIPVLDFISDTDVENDKQFCAGTFRITEGLYFVSFRGTDDSVVAWKEDFNMSFTSPVPAQEEAAAYLSRAMDKYEGSFITTGHSKGGNLSIYAASFIPEEKQRRVLEVYSFDGPGFPDKVLAEPGYRNMRERIRLYVPKSSIIGMLLSRDLGYTAVDSNATTAILQHDPYSWLIDEEGHFRTFSDTDEESKYVDATIRSTLEGMDDEDRAELTDIIFSLAESTGSDTVSGIRNNFFSSYISIMKSFSSMDKEERKVLRNSFGSLAGNALQNLSLLLNHRK